MKMVYDIDIKPINDRFVTISEKAVEKLSNSVAPGAAVNAFPFLRYFPGWLPGCGFQRYAEGERKTSLWLSSNQCHRCLECRLLTQEMQQVPFDFTKKRMVSGLA